MRVAIPAVLYIYLYVYIISTSAWGGGYTWHPPPYHGGWAGVKDT